MPMLLSWQRVRVSGPSMTPTLLSGDLLLVRHGATIKPGDVVLARFRSRPDLPVIKRLAGVSDGGWLLASDNARAGSDSRHYGVADVEARAVWMWPSGAGRRPVARWRRLAGRRIGGEPVESL